MYTIEEIKKYMKDNKITQIQLSEMSNIPLGSLRNIFSGRVPNPRMDTLRAIETALGLNKKATEETPSQSIEHLINHLRELPEQKQKELAPVIEHLINAVEK